MMFNAVKKKVKNRGVPPDSFLKELVEWGRGENPQVFATNSNPYDIYSYVRKTLGPWTSLLHRTAVMLEVMRVHAGFESSWNWNEGVDKTNKRSQKYKDGQETGIFQVSFDSTYLSSGAMKPFAEGYGVADIDTFIREMKRDHHLAMCYYARLIRVSVQWAGPIKRHEIDPWLNRDAVEEFQVLLS